MLPRNSTKFLSTAFHRLSLSSHGLLLLACGSGILMGLTPAPVNAWVLAWVALAPLWVLVLRPGTGAPLYALAWGIGYHGLALSWIRDLHPLTWMGIPWLASLAIAGFCWGFITLWGAALVMIWATLLRRCWGSKIPIVLRILGSTAIWCGLEALWGQGVLYWTSLSYTQSPFNLPILHLGQISGPLTVTAAIVFCNGIWAEAWLRFKPDQAIPLSHLSVRRLLIGNLAVLIGLHLIGWGLVARSISSPADTALKVGIVQGNIPTRIKLFEQGLQLSLDRYVQGYNSLTTAGVDAVLTSEGALPWLWINQPGDNPLYQAVLERAVPLWIGTIGMREGKPTQTLFSLAGNGQVVGRYDKVKLVPLGEYIPFEDALNGVIGRLSPVGASLLPGQPNQQLQTPFGLAIGGICYESAFPELFRQQAAAGGQFILTASNNDPYGRAMMSQHHAQDVMRAIETDRWAIRATNTGLSGIVDPHGHTQWLSSFRVYQTHAHTIYRRHTQTLYVRWGNWLTPTLLGATVVVWLLYRRRS